MSCAGTSRPESVGEGKQGSEWVKRSLRGSLLGFPMNLDALPDEILAWCWRRLLGRRLALGSAQRRHSSRGRRGHPATVTGRGRRWQAVAGGAVEHARRLFPLGRRWARAARGRRFLLRRGAARGHHGAERAAGLVARWCSSQRRPRAFRTRMVIYCQSVT